MCLKINLKQIINFLLVIALISMLSLIVFNINWFQFTSLQYDLDTFTYEKMLDSGAYNNVVENLNISGWLIIEPGWAFLLIELNKYFSSHNIIFIIIPFIILASYSLLLYRYSNYLYILFLLHPIALMFYLNQLRLAFAFCIFYIFFLFFKNKKNFFFFSFFLFFIHTSFLIFWAVFIYIEFILSRNRGNIYKFCMVFLGGTSLAFLTGPAIGMILTALGDRRAETYSDSLWQTSFLTSLYCLAFILIILSNFYFNKIKKVTFEQLCTLFFLAMVVVSPILIGGYPFRFLSAIFPIMLISFYQLDRVFSFYSTVLLMLIGIYIGFFQLNWIKILG